MASDSHGQFPAVGEVTSVAYPASRHIPSRHVPLPHVHPMPPRLSGPRSAPSAPSGVKPAAPQHSRRSDPAGWLYLRSSPQQSKPGVSAAKVSQSRVQRGQSHPRRPTHPGRRFPPQELLRPLGWPLPLVLQLGVRSGVRVGLEPCRWQSTLPQAGTSFPFQVPESGQAMLSAWGHGPLAWPAAPGSLWTQIARAAGGQAGTRRRGTPAPLAQRPARVVGGVRQ